ncbi:UDP-galactose phosphate transferase [Latilactobacillus graminis DSM 20719]|uniref:UDP-galactose phosphate transferase n=2 Tax=Latilactobacillus graminis TaxID=60519 RepID=A0AA89I1G1_9LACO|nr:UDP-galactose phosphate transferase [Latilactobacillus graminis DSM 20719]
MLSIVIAPICLVMITILAIISILWLHENPFFLSYRAGQKGHLFIIYKLKTMRTLVDQTGALLPDQKRVCFWGNILRASSLDELPQILNVVFGQMSFVGPRPLEVDYLPLYDRQQKRRLLVKPGITGWAQVNGRNTISWQQKFKLDCYYVDYWSIWFDIKILGLTVYKVLVREGVKQDGHVNMPRFTGNDD